MTFLVGVNEIHEGLDVVAVAEAGLDLPRAQPFPEGGVVFFPSPVEQPLVEGLFLVVGLLHMLPHPVRYLSVRDGIPDHGDEILGGDASGLEPFGGEAYVGEVGAHNVEYEQFKQTLMRRGLLTNFQLERLEQGYRTGFIYGEYKVLYLVGAGSFSRENR